MPEMVINSITLERASPTKAHDILIEARQYCPQVQLLEHEYASAADVYVARERRNDERWDASFLEDYEMTALRWQHRDGNVVAVLGFVAAGDFRPLDRSGEALRRLAEIAPLRQHEGARESYERLLDFLMRPYGDGVSAQASGTGEAGDKDVAVRLLWPSRIEASRGACDWRLLGSEDREQVARGIDAWGLTRAITPDDVLREAWFEEGRFFRTWRLIECISNRPGEDAVARWVIAGSMAGAGSERVHRVEVAVPKASENGELLLDTEARVEAYLRFYAWAVLDCPIPRAMREIPFVAAPASARRQVLRELDYSISRPVSDIESENRLMFRSAIIAYIDEAGSDKCAFAVFLIDRAVGTVTFHDLAPVGSIGADDSVKVPMTLADIQRHIDEGAGSITHKSFAEHVALDALTGAPEIEFWNCVFEDGLSGTRASLVLNRCTVSTAPTESQRAVVALRLDDARPKSGIQVAFCRLHGGIAANHIHTEGSVRIVASRIAPPEDAEPATFVAVAVSHGAIGGDFDICALVDGHNALNGGGRTEILGKLEARGLNVSGRVDIFGARFRGAVNFAGATFAQSARFSGEVQDSGFGASDLKCDGIRAKHGVTVSAATISGGVSFKQATVQGQLVFSGCTARFISLEETRVEGPLHFRECETTQGDLSLSKARVDGPVSLIGTAVNRGSLLLTFARVRGFLSAFVTVHDAQTRLSDERYPLRVDGNLDLSGAEVATVEMRGIKVGGALVAKMGTFNRLIFAPGVTRADSDADAGPPRPDRPSRAFNPARLSAMDAPASGCHSAVTSARSAVTGSSARVAYNEVGAVSIKGIAVDGHVDLSGLRVTTPKDSYGRESLDLQADPGCTVVESRIGGHLVFSLERPDRDLERRWGAPVASQAHLSSSGTQGGSRWLAGDEVSAEVDAKLDLSGNWVGGMLRMQNVTVRGAIDLSDARVGRDVRLGTRVNNDLPELRTTCTELKAEMLRCEGDVDLTGLDVTAGSLQLRGTTVAGDLLLAPLRASAATAATSAGASAHARVSGHIDLTAVTANRLVLSGDNLIDPDSGGVTLERGRLDRLEIVDPVPVINLSQLTVGGWEFGKGKEEDSAGVIAECYGAVLDRMRPFDRSVWTAVERTLREEGKDEVADLVYVRGRRRQRRARRQQEGERHSRGSERRRPVSHRLGVMWHVWDAVHDLYTMYGTRVRRPAIAWVICFLFSAVILSDPASVRATTAVLQVVGDPVPASGQAAPSFRERLNRTPPSLDEKWTWLDGAALALRYMVPMAHFITHDRWEASDRVLLPRLPLMGERVSWLTAERWAFLSVIIGWLTLPIVLIHLAAKAVRGVKH